MAYIANAPAARPPYGWPRDRRCDWRGTSGRPTRHCAWRALLRAFRAHAARSPVYLIAGFAGGDQRGLQHPFVDDYLGSLASSPLAGLGDVTRYAAIDEDWRPRAKIALFHHRYDGVDYSCDQVLAGAGSSMLLGTFCTWLMLAGYSQVHYLPPVYYKFTYLFKSTTSSRYRSVICMLSS